VRGRQCRPTTHRICSERQRRTSKTWRPSLTRAVALLSARPVAAAPLRMCVRRSSSSRRRRSLRRDGFPRPAQEPTVSDDAQDRWKFGSFAARTASLSFSHNRDTGKGTTWFSLLKFLMFSSLSFHHITLNTPKGICSEY
jgi:hypothetical protein